MAVVRLQACASLYCTCGCVIYRVLVHVCSAPSCISHWVCVAVLVVVPCTTRMHTCVAGICCSGPVYRGYHTQQPPAWSSPLPYPVHCSTYICIAATCLSRAGQEVPQVTVLERFHCTSLLHEHTHTHLMSLSSWLMMSRPSLVYLFVQWHSSILA